MPFNVDVTNSRDYILGNMNNLDVICHLSDLFSKQVRYPFQIRSNGSDESYHELRIILIPRL